MASFGAARPELGVLIVVFGSGLVVAGVVAGVVLIVTRRWFSPTGLVPVPARFRGESRGQRGQGASRSWTVLPRSDRFRFHKKGEGEVMAELTGAIPEHVIDHLADEGDADDPMENVNDPVLAGSLFEPDPNPEPEPAPGLLPVRTPDLPQQDRHETELSASDGSREPSIQQQEPLRAAAAQLEGFTGRTEIARIVCGHAAEVVGNGDVALLIRSIEGPMILWPRSDAGQRTGLWGPETLGALLMVGVSLRDVVPANPTTGEPAAAILAVPIPSGGVHSGVLVARRSVTQPFFASEEDALARLARMAGAAFYAVSRRGWAGDEPQTDPVTGFWPVERLLGDLRAALRSAQDHRMPSGLIMAEITGLRGRRRSSSDPTAEAVLFALAEAVGAQLRVGDVAYRTGQDELAVLLPGTDVADARTVEARLRVHIEMMVPGWQIRTGTVPVTGVAEDVLAAARRMLADSGPSVVSEPRTDTGPMAAPQKRKASTKRGTATKATSRSRGGLGTSGGKTRSEKPGGASPGEERRERGESRSTTGKTSNRR